ncbi:MAG: transcription-repair coupling factor [Myxococcota bacterium]|nr:transcription-repair coupling factor [Myxococcota bacterium]
MAAGTSKTHGASRDRTVERVVQRDGPIRLTGLRGASRAVVGARLVEAHPDAPVLFLTANAKAADALLDDLHTCLGEQEPDRRSRAFPRHDTLPYDRFSPQPFVIAQRMDVLYRWLAAANPQNRAMPAPVAVAPWTALALRVPSRDSLRARSVHLEIAQTIDRDALVEILVNAGYARMPLVEEPGEIAVRGGILDVFPPHLSRPVRIELLGDEIESIREFDAASQRSQDKLSGVVAPPPRELLFDRELVVQRSESLREMAHRDRVPARTIDEVIDALLRGHIPPGAEALGPYLQPEQETVFDFLPDDTLIVLDDPEGGLERLAHYFEEASDNFVAAREGGRAIAAPDELLIPPEIFEASLGQRHPVSLERLDIIHGQPESHRTEAVRLQLRATSHDDLRRELIQTRTHDRALLPLVHFLQERVSNRFRIAIACSALSSADRLQALLDEYGIEARIATDPRPISRWAAPGRIEIRVAPISSGFDLPAEKLTVLTEEEIFGRREKKRRRRSWQEGAAIDGLGQLAVGDFLVHVEHGIGKYRGLVELAVGGLEAELLCIEYEGADRLFLPVDRLNLVQRYGSADGVQPRIDRLGGDSWQRAKRKVKKSLRVMASDLLSLHAARELAPGFAFSVRDAYFEEFEARFPFNETPDQADAIDDVLMDMQKAKPMDRLVCGDVGYGKTEVALRAAFRAVMDGKQVAVLVPTTILCQQHVATFAERFAGYPLEIEFLSRFRSPKESKQVLEGLASGRVDIVIGTHRLLQKNVRFRDLGLLVIDEEHRFGVAHKEKIKRIKKTVDVLTLTATPIPRTLQLSFTGLRDLSLINTAPVDRLAVRTQVARFDEHLIREAILREVRRGGQVYFMHNRVRTIGALAEMLERVAPEVKVIVAHGQMPERELEAKMLAFQNGEADLLLCTTIIESGLDIPRVNTILINRADALGLAQLYQLRGRVGRSSQRAYAYLLVPTTTGAMSDDAQKRLEAIQDLSELGSGFRLANMDLEIRGAGNLLGAEQSGNLRSVGYETYMELLEETIEELRGNITQAEIDPEIRLPVVARLPEAYVSDVSQRLVLYKRLASSRDESELGFVRDEILDRYGAMPQEVQNLVDVIRTKLMARSLGVMAVSVSRGELVLTVSEATNIDPERLVQLLTHAGANVRVTPDHKIHAPGPPAGSGPTAIFDCAQDLMVQLGARPA